MSVAQSGLNPAVWSSSLPNEVMRIDFQASNGLQEKGKKTSAAAAARTMQEIEEVCLQLPHSFPFVMAALARSAALQAWAENTFRTSPSGDFMLMLVNRAAQTSNPCLIKVGTARYRAVKTLVSADVGGSWFFTFDWKSGDFHESCLHERAQIRLTSIERRKCRNR